LCCLYINKKEKRTVKFESLNTNLIAKRKIFIQGFLLPRYKNKVFFIFQFFFFFCGNSSFFVRVCGDESHFVVDIYYSFLASFSFFQSNEIGEKRKKNIFTNKKKRKERSNLSR
jgi:hypothetical protein